MPQTIPLPALNPDERLAGLMLDDAGAPAYWLVLLPDTPAGELTWDAAVEWAKSLGTNRTGVGLPNRREQSLLFASLPAEFERDWYWSGEQHAAHSFNAWYQVFVDGGQSYYGKSAELRVRAVRRSPI